MRLAVIGLRGFPNVQGGVEAHCLQLIPRLARTIKCRVYRRRPYLNTEATAASYPGVEFVDLPSTRIKGFEAVFHTFLSVIHIALHKVDCVNVHNIGPGMFTPLLRLLGLRVILTYHSPNYEHDKWGRVSKAILRLAESISLRCAHHIIFVSPFQMAKYPTWVRKKSTVIPNGITPLPHTSDTEFLTRIGTAPGKYILAVGRLTPEKGFETLVRAIQDCPTDYKLVIAGDSDHDPHARAKLKALDSKDKLILPGFTAGAELAQLYSHARALALPSLAEGFPMVLLEGMSFGLPVVASDIPAAHIIPLPPGHYARPADSESLAKALVHVLETQSPPVTYPLDPYNWDSIALTTAEIYM